MGNTTSLPKKTTMYITTANVTCWTSCRRWLSSFAKGDLPPQVLLVHEHKLATDEGIDEARKAAKQAAAEREAIAAEEEYLRHAVA